MVCALCGEKINGDGSMDHVFPRALYKWNEKFLSDEEYAKLELFINMKDNILLTHDSCNKTKEDSIVEIDSLYISESQKNALRSVEVYLKDIIADYKMNKEMLLEKQEYHCFACRTVINGQGVLRRIDPDKERVWDNACVVCHDCNNSCKDFIGI